MRRAPLTLVVGEHEQPDIAELVELYLHHRLAGTWPKPGRSRALALERILRGFAHVVGTTTIDETAVRRWLTSRTEVAPGTRYDDFCTVRALCMWLAERRFIKPIAWDEPSWPRSPRTQGWKVAARRARLSEAAFEEYLYGAGLSPRSIGEYVHEVIRAKAWMSERGHDLATAPASVVASYCETRPRSWSTRKMVRSALRHWWTMTGHPSPPISAIRVPPKPRGHCRALEEDASRILAEAARTRGDDPGLAVALMLYAGLRRTEVATLRWECFDTSLEWVTIHGKLDVEATIPVHVVLRQLLGAKGPGTGYVFPGRFADRPSTGARIWHWVRRVAEDAGIPNVAPHRLRHVAVATVNDNTGDLRAAQDFARHADPRTTAIYTRTTEKRLLAAVEAIDY